MCAQKLSASFSVNNFQFRALHYRRQSFSLFNFIAIGIYIQAPLPITSALHVAASSLKLLYSPALLSHASCALLSLGMNLNLIFRSRVLRIALLTFDFMSLHSHPHVERHKHLEQL
jgi:hypothetical protein